MLQANENDRTHGHAVCAGPAHPAGGPGASTADVPAGVLSLQTEVISDVEAGRSNHREDSPIGDWWLVHTRPRQEKALAAHLDQLGIRYFLPLVRVHRRYAQRTSRIKLPLFPSYLFMRGGRQERHAALLTHRALDVIAVGDQQRLDHELHQVQLITEGDESVEMFDGLKRGKRFRVRSGKFAGIEGVPILRRAMCRLFVGIEALRRSAVVKVDPDLLEMTE